MTATVPDAPRPVVRRGYRRGVPIGVLCLVVTAVVHARLLPAVDRLGAAGDRALERWLVALAATAAVTTWAWMVATVRLDPGANRWVVPPRHSGSPPVPDPPLGWFPFVVANVAIVLGSFLAVLAANGPRDAALLTVAVLTVQLAGALAAAVVPLVLVMPVVTLVAGTRRRGPAEDGGGPTGPVLVSSGVASLAAVLLPVLVGLALARVIPPGLALGAALGSVLAFVGALVHQVRYVRRARPDARAGVGPPA